MMYCHLLLSTLQQLVPTGRGGSVNHEHQIDEQQSGAFTPASRQNSQQTSSFLQNTCHDESDRRRWEGRAA
eukprot:4456953-Amphidinium_carterae.1